MTAVAKYLNFIILQTNRQGNKRTNSDKLAVVIMKKQILKMHVKSLNILAL